jgi:uncharacterized membrane protein
MKLAVMFHVLGIVIWVGGMFFAYVVLRPAASQLLAPPQRLPLWSGTLAGFFRWVWVAVALVLGSGFYMVIGISEAGRIPLYVHAMLYVGLLMTLIFAYVFFSPFPALRRAVAGEDWSLAGSTLNRIRIAVAVNLALGLFNIVIATAGAL